jgi:hypothetical protein
METGPRHIVVGFGYLVDCQQSAAIIGDKLREYRAGHSKARIQTRDIRLQEKIAH